MLSIKFEMKCYTIKNMVSEPINPKLNGEPKRVTILRGMLENSTFINKKRKKDTDYLMVEKFHQNLKYFKFRNFHQNFETSMASIFQWREISLFPNFNEIMRFRKFQNFNGKFENFFILFSPISTKFQ